MTDQQPDLRNKRNLSKQVINTENGPKTIWHEKKFNGPGFGSFTDWWRTLNKQIKPGSKRQDILKQKAIDKALIPNETPEKLIIALD